MALLQWGTVGFVIGVALAPWVPVSVRTALLVAAGAGLLALRWPRWVALAGLGCGWLAVATLPPGLQLSGRVALQGVVVGAPMGRSAQVAVSRWAAPGDAWREGAGRVLVRFPERAPGPGTPLVVYGKAGTLGRMPTLPGAPDPVRAASRSRLRTLVRVEDHAVLGGDGTAVPAPDVPHRGVLKAIATGDRTEIDEATWEVFRRTGTAHLLAISGFHVGMVALVAGWIARRFVRMAGVARHVGVSDPAWVVGVLAAATYAVAAGAPVSAQRAVGLVVLVAWGRAQGREIRPLGLLGLVAVAILVVDPAAIATPGFQLSFGALLGLVRVTPVLTRHIPEGSPALLRWVLAGLATTTAATVGTLPAAAWWFQQLAPWSLPANLLAIPWTGFVVIPCAVLAQIAPAPLSNWAWYAGDAAVEALLTGLGPLAVAPWTPAVGPAGAVVLLALPLWPRRPGVWAWALLVALGLRVVPAVPTVTFLDVGQGDAALVEADGERWLFDTGKYGGSVVAFLRRRGIRHLDAVVASHGEADHVGGLPELLDAIAVDVVYISDPHGLDDVFAAATRNGVPVVVLSEALHPPEGFDGNANDRSLVLQRAGVLFTGDIEKRGERRLSGLPIATPVLKVPHHGSKTSSSSTLLRAVNPVLAVASVGRDNRYRHPHPTVVARYQALGIPLLRTDRDGTIEVRRFADRLEVRAHRAGRGWAPVGVYAADAASASARRPPTYTSAAMSTTTTLMPWE